MKLFTKTSLYYSAVAFFLFLAGSIVFYFYLKNVIHEDMEENLQLEKDKIIQYTNDSLYFPSSSVLSSDILTFYKTDKAVPETLRDTLLYNVLEEEDQKFKQLVFSVEIKGQYYTASLSKPMFEADDLLDAIVTILGIIAIIMLIVMFLLTRILSKKMLKPLYDMLEKLRMFDVNISEKLNFPSTSTSEFALLHTAIETMAGRIQQDYQNMKVFNENASHEMQTPLAIIRAKLELLFQENNLPDEQVKVLHEIYASTNRLSKLNQSMLLLSKIENRQFHETEKIFVENVLNEKLQQFEELINHKNISVEKKYISNPHLQINAYLCDILLSNLLGNAIKHNIQNGKIVINLSEDSLHISNTGNPPEFPLHESFERFKKSNSSSESTGLGLAIVKQICDLYGFSIKYTYREFLHHITIQF